MGVVLGHEMFSCQIVVLNHFVQFVFFLKIIFNILPVAQGSELRAGEGAVPVKIRGRKLLNTVLRAAVLELRHFVRLSFVLP